LKGIEGYRPRLTAAAPLPGNPEVQAFDCVLPPGVDATLVRSALGKVAAAMSYGWVEPRPSPRGAGALRLLAAEEVPLPAFVPFDFAVEVSWEEGLPFAADVEGGRSASARSSPRTCSSPVPQVPARALRHRPCCGRRSRQGPWWS